MDRLYDGVRRRRQDPVDKMGTGNRLGLGAAVTFELGPDAGKGGERPIVVQRKPDDVLLFGLGIWFGRVLGEAI